MKFYNELEDYLANNEVEVKDNVFSGTGAVKDLCKAWAEAYMGYHQVDEILNVNTHCYKQKEINRAFDLVAGEILDYEINGEA